MSYDCLARDFLEIIFNDMRGHYHLKKAAIGTEFDNFCCAFQFKKNVLEKAKGEGNQNAQFDFLLQHWCNQAKTVADLKNALERWQNTELLLLFGLSPTTPMDPAPPAPPFAPSAIK